VAGKTAKPKELVVERRWAEIAAAPKTPVLWPAWSDPEPPPPSTKPMSRSDLHSVAAETTEVVIPLGDASGVGLEGVRLRLSAWAYRRLYRHQYGER
jgi:hypothetical protein